MCGIAGIVRFDDAPIDADRLEAMRHGIRHRGPDGEGVSVPGRCGLAHARLAILDPAGGGQPMSAAGLGLHVVFNGEIYNHRELRRQLEQLGHRFRTDHSDTEVLLWGYRQWGSELPRRLEGMFAFAIWDEAERRLFLCRDRTGQKPLYVGQAHGELTFASLAAVVAGDAPRPDAQALLTFLRYGYTFERSLIAGVEELPPAHWMSVDAEGRTQLTRYWQPPQRGLEDAIDEPRDELEAVLRDAVARRLDADVEVACFLSGGIDSSLIAALAQQILRERGAPPLRTFSVAMPDADYDESPYAQAVAEHIGSNHQVLPVQAGDAAADLARLMAITGEPTADSSLLPTHWLCRTVRQQVKAAISGDGGDELFGGYDRYRALRLLRRFGPWIAALPPALLGHARPRTTRARVRRLVEAAREGVEPARQYQQMIHLFTHDQIEELWHEAPHVHAGLHDWPDVSDPVTAAMAWDLSHYLPFDLLRKMDRASMAVALEVRSPLLDTQVVELACRLPPMTLMPDGRPKGLLREVARRHLPDSIVRRPKRGFAVPIGGWFRTSLRDVLADHLFDGSLESLGLTTPPVRRWFEEHMTGRADHTHQLFALWQLSLWQHWRQGRV